MNRRCLIINLIAIVVFVFTVTGFAADNKPSVAVLDFESMGTEDYLGKAVSEIMRTALVSNQNYRVVERAQINKALSEQKFQKSGIIDDKSAVEIGKVLGADLIIVGSVVKIGNAYTINSRMIDVKTGEAKLGRNVTGTDLNLLTSMSNELVENLFGTASKQVKQKTTTDKKVVSLDSWEVLDFTGKWEMTANISYQFLLEIIRQGDRITGTMTRTNGSEPVDYITGQVSTDGTIQFIRHREGAWRQDYTGRISRETGNLLIEGTFSHDRSGSYPWQAKRVSVVVEEQSVTLSPGWDIFSDRLSSGKVVWKTVEDQGDHNLQVVFQLRGAQPDHEYTAGVHLFNPTNLTARPVYPRFDGLEVGGQGVYSRDEKIAYLIPWDFGGIRTDSNGNGIASFQLAVPQGTYHVQFTVRIGGSGTCQIARGISEGCSVVYRTGGRFAEQLHTLLIPSWNVSKKTDQGEDKKILKGVLKTGKGQGSSIDYMNLDNWEVLNGQWYANDGAIIGSGGHLIMKEEFRDYIFEVTVEHLSGPKSGVGVATRCTIVPGGQKLFRNNTSINQGYTFNFSFNKNYNIYSGLSGNWYPMNPNWKKNEWQHSDFFNEDINNIRIEATGKNMKMFVNNRFLVEYSDSSHSVGSPLLWVQDPAERIRFFNIRILKK